MVVTCLIEFDSNPAGVFFAGQAINGSVTLEANKSKTCEGVVVKVYGFARTSWSGFSDKSYSETEQYFSSEANLLMPAPGETQIEIIPGIHTFTFSCIIPPNCPSSFETRTNGHIRYLAEVTLKRSWKFDQTFSKAFTVIKNLDINLDDPLFKTAFTNEEHKFYGCGPCKSDPLSLKLTLPSTGFVPGQSIPVNVLIDNQTNIDVREVVVELWLTVLYHAESEQTQESFAISKLVGDPVLRYSKKLFNYSIVVPPTPPSDTRNSKLINISYEVRLNASVKGAHLKKFIAAPVTIGSILSSSQGFIVKQPIGSTIYERSLMQAVTSTKYDENKTYNNSEMNLQPIPAAHWSTNMPFVFEETHYMPPACLALNPDYGDQSFKPKFPVYNFAEPPAETVIGEVTTWL